MFRYSKFGDGDYQQILWNIQCTGSETNLASCNNYHDNYCYYGYTVGIKCYSMEFTLFNNKIYIFVQIHLIVLMVKSSCMGDSLTLKEIYKFVIMECGFFCVIGGGFHQMLCVDSLVILITTVSLLY